MQSNRSYSLTLLLIGLTTLVFVAIVGIFKPDNESMMVPVMIHAMVIVIILCWNPRPIALILILGLFLRLAFLYIDVKTNIPVFSSGQDTENFYKVALSLYEFPDLIREDLYGGVFPKLVGIFFWIVGPQRLLVQYLNVLMGVIVLILIVMSANVLGASKKNINIVLTVCALMPVSASISAIFLRESLITLLIAISVYWFCCWFKSPSIFYTIGSLLMVACAGIFHFGVFGVAFGYLVAYFLYDHQSGKFVWSFGRLISMAPIVIGFSGVIFSFSGLFLEKLGTVSSTNDLLAKASNSSGGSAYLPGVEINTPAQFLLYGGIKALLLLVSPPPWMWRVIMDIVSFALDGLPFLIALITIIIAFKRLPSGGQKKLVTVLSIGIVVTALIIGSGTANSGTAMRHRQKIVPLVAVAVIFSLPSTRSRREELEKVMDSGFSNPRAVIGNPL